MKLLLCFAFALSLPAQFPNAVPRSQSAVDADTPSIKTFGAKGDTQFYWAAFSTSAGSTAVSVTGLQSTTNTAAITASSAAQLITYASTPQTNFAGYLIQNPGGPDQEQVTCVVFALFNCLAVYSKNHPAGETEQPAVFFPGDVGKQIRIAGAGPATNPTWHTLVAPGGLTETTTAITCPTPACQGTISASGTQTAGQLQFLAWSYDNSFTWSIWGSNNASFSGESMVHTATVAGFQITSGAGCNSTGCWNSRDIYTITNPAYAYYRVKTIDGVSGTHALTGIDIVGVGPVLASTIATYVDTFHVTIAAPAAATASQVAGMFGTDDTKATQNALAGVATAAQPPWGAPGQGMSNKLYVPSGTYWLSSSINNEISGELDVEGTGSSGSTFIFDPAMTAATTTDAEMGTIPYLWWQNGSNGYDYGSILRKLTINCNEVAAAVCLYMTVPQEYSGLDEVTAEFFYGQKGIFVEGGQNFSFRKVNSIGAYRAFPQQMCYLTQTVTPSSSPQTVSVNSTAMWTTGAQADVGWLTATREQGLTMTVIDGTHLSGTYLKAHSISDPLHHTNMPIGVDLNNIYVGFHDDQSTRTGTTQSGAGDGIGTRIQCCVGEFNDQHAEGAIATLDLEGATSSVVTGSSANYNTAVAIANYSTGDTQASNTGGARGFGQWFDGVTGTADQGFGSMLHVAVGDTVTIDNRGSPFYGEYNFFGALQVTGEGVTMSPWIPGSLGPPNTTGNTASIIGGFSNPMGLLAAQNCTAGGVFMIAGNNYTGTSGVARSGTYPSPCSPTYGNAAGFAVTANNNTVLNRLMFGSAAGSVLDYGLTVNCLGFGNPLWSTGQWNYRWCSDGAGGVNVHLQAIQYGGSWTDILDLNGATAQVTAPGLVSGALATPGSVLVDTGTGAAGSVEDGTAPGVATFIGGTLPFSGTIPLAKLTTGGSAGSETVVNGLITAVVPPT